MLEAVDEEVRDFVGGLKGKDTCSLVCGNRDSGYPGWYPSSGSLRLPECSVVWYVDNRNQLGTDQHVRNLFYIHSVRIGAALRRLYI
jgi:hypothetical protein